MFLLWTKRNAFEKTFTIKTAQEITGKTTKSKEIFVQIWERKVWKAILVIKDLSETFNNHYFNIIEKRTEWKEKIETDLRKFCDMDIDSDI